MNIEQTDKVLVETIEIQSASLGRIVKIDFYHTHDHDSDSSDLLLINDGQDLKSMDFQQMLEDAAGAGRLRPLLIAGIHCGENRTQEYGMVAGRSVNGLGARAKAYEQFVRKELIPFIHSRFHYLQFNNTAFAGFSLGGLSALDIVFHNPGIFSTAGVFSGSLWWRSIDKNDKSYDPQQHRMMHAQWRGAPYREGARFFFQCGEQDEAEDRNQNGVIDSIDDTIDLMRELVRTGYREGKEIAYLQLPDGKHDVESWKKALPAFLHWAWQVADLHS